MFGAETEDLDITVLAWPEHYSIESHVNSEVDVVMIVISGCGIAIVDGERYEMRLGSMLIIKKGSERSIESRSVDFRYINVHKRRRGLMPGLPPSKTPA